MTETSARDDQGSRPAHGNRVVVGVDGSDGSLAAVIWALREARLRGATLHVVLGWGYHPNWGAGSSESMFLMGYTASGGGIGGGLGGSRIAAPIDPPVRSAENVEAEASELARKVLDEVISKAVEHDEQGGEQTVTITRQAVHGHGAKVLLDEVSESDLLVVGARGHGAFLGALLGSVSHHVVSQAPCPVVVVPARQSQVQ